MTRAGEDAAQFWEDHYRAGGRVWSGRPNSVLVEVAEGLPPSSALDLGCGEGGDAVWLAKRGWRVTATDVSDNAIRRARTLAASNGVAFGIRFERHDLTRNFPEGTFDLVNAHYLHSPVAFPRADVLRAAAARVAVGGLLLIVDHASVSPWSWDPDQQTRFPAPEETLAELELPRGHWRTERLDAPQRQATGPDGQTATVTDNVILVRHTAS